MLYGGGFGGFPPMYGVNPFQQLYAQLMQQQARPMYGQGGMPQQQPMQPQFTPNQLLAMQAGSGSRAAYLPFNTPVGGMHGGQLGGSLAGLGDPTGGRGGIMGDYGNGRGSWVTGEAGRAAGQLGPPPPSSIPYVPPGRMPSPQPTPMQNMGFPQPMQRIPGQGFGSQPGANGPAGWGQPQVSRWSSQGPSPTRPQWKGPGVGTSGLGFS